jgi:hypothetical protein
MTEANPIKFYMAKYFLLVFALMLWITGAVLLYLDEFTLPNLALDGLFILIGIVLVVVFVKFSSKLKRVVVGPNKFVILEGHSNLRFEWPEVKSFRILPFLNVCHVKLRGKRGSIYFFFTGSIRSMLESISSRFQQTKKGEMGMNNPSPL